MAPALARILSDLGLEDAALAINLITLLAVAAQSLLARFRSNKCKQKNRGQRCPQTAPATVET